MRGAARGTKPATLLTALGLVGLCLWLVEPVAASEFRIAPFLSISEEYNDNIFEVPVRQRTDWITRIQPGGSLHFESPRLDADAAYILDYRRYARGTKDNEFNHDLKLHGLGRLVDNFFFLDLNDSYSRVPLDVARDTTKESLTTNQTDQNILTISPFLMWRLGEKATLKTGYLFRDTRYSDGSQNLVGTSTTATNKREHGTFATLDRQVSTRLNVLVNYANRNVSTDDVSYDQHEVSGEFKYEYADKCFFSGSIGNVWQNFSVGGKVNNLVWSAKLVHDFERVVVGLDTGVFFTEDPLSASTKQTRYGAKLDVPFSHGSVGLSTSYSEYLLTQTGVMDNRQTVVGANGRYEWTPKIATGVAVDVDKLTGADVTDYPYHLVGTAALSYLCNHDLTFNLSYTHVLYRRKWDSSVEEKVINRVALELKKAF